MRAKILSIAFILSIILAMLKPSPIMASALDFCDPPGFPGAFVFEIGNPYSPAIAHTSNGDTIEMDAFGTLDPFGYYNVIDGDFRYKDPSGNIVYQGTWTSGVLLKYKNYGCNEGGKFWPGGRAAFRIIMTATDGSVFNGTLDAESPNGDSPAGAIDGIRLSVKAWGLYFNQPVSVHDNVIFSIF